MDTKNLINEDYYEFLKPSSQDYFKAIQYEKSPYESGIGYVPRVTNIVNYYTDQEALTAWRSRMFKRGVDPDIIVEQASDFGSKTHKGIEMFLKNEPIPKDTPLYPFQSFLSWWSILSSKFTLKVLGQETKLVVDEFGGTYDLLLQINEKIYIVDFKTSSKVHFKYFVQLAAYAHALRRQGIYVNGYMILHLSRTKDEFKEYVLDYSIPSHLQYAQMCENAYFAALSVYNHFKILNEGFKNENWDANFYREE